MASVPQNPNPEPDSAARAANTYSYAELVALLPEAKPDPANWNRINFKCPLPKCEEPEKAYVLINKQREIHTSCAGCFQGVTIGNALGLTGKRLAEEPPATPPPPPPRTATPSLVSYAIAYARKGYRVFPCWWLKADGDCACPMERRKPGHKPGKHPIHKGWPELATTDKNQIRKWWNEYPDANIGVACGQASNLTVLDVDVKPPQPSNVTTLDGEVKLDEGIDGRETLRALERQHGKLPDTVIVTTGSGCGGCQYYFEYEPTIGNEVKFDHGLDTRNERGLVIGVGSVTTQRYEWDGLWSLEVLAPAKMPRWLVDYILAQTQKERSNGRYAPPAKITRGFQNNNIWKMTRQQKALGYSLEATVALMQIEGQRRFDPKIPPDEMQALVEDHYNRPDKPDFKQASEGQPAEWPEPQPLTQSKTQQPADGTQTNGSAPHANGEIEVQCPNCGTRYRVAEKNLPADTPRTFRCNKCGHVFPRFKLTRFNAIEVSTEPDYVVKNLIPGNALVLIWGPPKCGKSFVAFDLSMHIATGFDYRGHTVRQSPVVYCALEGGGGFARRKEAWRLAHEEDLQGMDPPFYLMNKPMTLVDDQTELVADIAEQVAEMPAKPPSTIIIDTLNRTLGDLEENTSDMAKIVAAADAVRLRFKATVIIVHHCGINENRPRGHTSLRGALDAMIAVSKTEAGLITVEVEEMRDDEPPPPLACRLERIQVGVNDEGEAIYSMVVQPAVTTGGPKKTHEKKPTALEKRFLDLLADAIRTAQGVDRNDNIAPDGSCAISRIWLKTYLGQHGFFDPQSTAAQRRSKVSGMLNQLAGKDWVGLTDMFVWITRD